MELKSALTMDLGTFQIFLDDDIVTLGEITTKGIIFASLITPII